MNEALTVLMDRKSMREFEPKDVPFEIKEKILAAVMRAPTAGNSMLYTIIDVTDQAKKDILAVSCDNQPFIATAPIVLVFLADYRRWVRKFEQAGLSPAAPDLSDLLLATNDAVIAAHTACVAADSLGLGSCYIGDILENWETHQELFNLPEYVAPVSMLVMGYPTKRQLERAQPSRFPKQMIIHENHYNDLSGEALQEFRTDEQARNFFRMKYTSDFSAEAARSVAEIFKNWNA